MIDPRKLRIAVEASPFSPQALAKSMGIDFTTIYRWLDGSRVNITPGYLTELAHHLDVLPGDLLKTGPKSHHLDPDTIDACITEIRGACHATWTDGGMECDYCSRPIKVLESLKAFITETDTSTVGTKRVEQGENIG